MSFRGEDDAHTHAGGLMNMMVEIIQKIMLMKMGWGGRNGRMMRWKMRMMGILLG